MMLIMKSAFVYYLSLSCLRKIVTIWMTCHFLYRSYCDKFPRLSPSLLLVVCGVYLATDAVKGHLIIIIITFIITFIL